MICIPCRDEQGIMYPASHKCSLCAAALCMWCVAPIEGGCACPQCLLVTTAPRPRRHVRQHDLNNLLRVFGGIDIAKEGGAAAEVSKEKVCIGCGVSKLHAAFSSDASRDDGKNVYCRVCRQRARKQALARQRYAASRQAVVA